MKKIYVVLGALGLAAAGGIWWAKRATSPAVAPYRTVQIRRGDLQSTVSATGTVNAVTTVQVGTQVSGQVSAIFADFNDKVKKGQLLARIDPTLAQQAVAEAQAALVRVQAMLMLADQEYQRAKQLFDGQMITQSDYQTALSNYTVSKADVTSSKVNLERARKNLSYTSIYAPVDGVIVERDVDVGQTVAASLSAPQLFLIAKDLAQMQILAAVDESDIGGIKEGLSATFTVPSYPTRMFAGLVKQVRLQSKTTDNVVNYTTVIAVENPGGSLLPGMTATVTFITAAEKNVLLVPNAALRFRPAATMVATTSSSAGPRRTTIRPDTARGDSGTKTVLAPDGTVPAAQAPVDRVTTGTLWRVGPDGKLLGTTVVTGISDGQRTVLLGDELAAGTEVVIGAAAVGATAATSSTNPLQPQRTQGAGRQRPL